MTSHFLEGFNYSTRQNIHNRCVITMVIFGIQKAAFLMCYL
jgi:hypothetical protein